uniref:Uncharacterized protein n=1 Tax=Neospora caninum (strain Liverpool) TaxID=572307 RepID=A0A0F7UF99_NEOCL|nr:TPA: hypothetical protein BN1204_035185 [Neospora caninum Liverpool]
MTLSREGQASHGFTWKRSNMSSRFNFLFSKRGSSLDSSPSAGGPLERAADSNGGRRIREGAVAAESLASNTSEADPRRVSSNRSAPERSRQDSPPARPSSRLSFREMYRRLLKRQRGRKRRGATAAAHSSFPGAAVTTAASSPPLTRVKSVHFGKMVVHTYPRDAQPGGPDTPMFASKSDPSIVFVPDSGDESDDASDEEKDDCIFANRHVAPALHPGRSVSSTTSSDWTGPRSFHAAAGYMSGDSSSGARRMQFGRCLSDTQEETTLDDDDDDDSFPPKSFLEYHGDEFGISHYFNGSTGSRGSTCVSHQSTSNSLLKSFSSVAGGKPPGPNDKELENVLMGWCS